MLPDAVYGELSRARCLTWLTRRSAWTAGSSGRSMPTFSSCCAKITGSVLLCRVLGSHRAHSELRARRGGARGRRRMAVWRGARATELQTTSRMAVWCGDASRALCGVRPSRARRRRAGKCLENAPAPTRHQAAAAATTNTTTVPPRVTHTHTCPIPIRRNWFSTAKATGRGHHHRTCSVPFPRNVRRTNKLWSFLSVLDFAKQWPRLGVPPRRVHLYMLLPTKAHGFI